jgi:hypothetical protein
VEGVAHGDDASAERDLVARQAVRVAAAVEALVAGADQRRHRAERRRGAQDALADDRVLAHERPLPVVERPGLGENRVRHGHLADVVELGGPGHALAVLTRESEPRGGRDRQLGDHADVAAQVGLALVQRL